MAIVQAPSLNARMNILITVVSFHYLTGSELYVYELVRGLVRRGHRVTVAANLVGGVLAEPARRAGLNVFHFGTLPEHQHFDLIHANEPYPTQWALARFPGVPIVCTVHSQFSCEQPVVDDRIRHYICVRPEVQEKITTSDGIPLEKTSVIYNPIDFERFHPIAGPKHQPFEWDLCPETLAPKHGRRVLFCGTMDLRRKQTILDLVERSQSEGFSLRLVGRKPAGNYDGFVEHLPPNVTWFDETWRVEDHLSQCDETASILLGRTTIEGWACGKPGWIYDVDLASAIRSRALHQPPADMERFDSRHVVDQIEQLYQKVLDGR